MLTNCSITKQNRTLDSALSWPAAQQGPSSLSTCLWLLLALTEGEVRGSGNQKLLPRHCTRTYANCIGCGAERDRKSESESEREYSKFQLCHQIYLFKYLENLWTPPLEKFVVSARCCCRTLACNLQIFSLRLRRKLFAAIVVSSALPPWLLLPFFLSRHRHRRIIGSNMKSQ